VGRTRLATDGTADSKIISNAIRELRESNEQLQKDNAKTTKRYQIITILTAIGCTILGVVIGKFILI